jgi:hypothetical protein
MGILDFRFSILDCGLCNFGLWTLDFGLWTLDFGLRTLDFGLWISDARSRERGALGFNLFPGTELESFVCASLDGATRPAGASLTGRLRTLRESAS